MNIIDSHIHICRCINGFGNSGEMQAIGGGYASYADGTIFQMIPECLGEYDVTPEAVLKVMDEAGVSKAVMLQGNFLGPQNHSSALVYSTRLRVSVCGTGTCRIKFSGFSWKYDYTHYWIVLRTLHTIRFDSCSGFAWNNQHLHPSTDYSVSPRRCHDSVSTSLPQVVPEY